MRGPPIHEEERKGQRKDAACTGESQAFQRMRRRRMREEDIKPQSYDTSLPMISRRSPSLSSQLDSNIFNPHFSRWLSGGGRLYCIFLHDTPAFTISGFWGWMFLLLSFSPLRTRLRVGLHSTYMVWVAIVLLSFSLFP
jgi:hypothetical protein